MYCMLLKILAPIPKMFAQMRRRCGALTSIAVEVMPTTSSVTREAKPTRVASRGFGVAGLSRCECRDGMGDSTD